MILPNYISQYSGEISIFCWHSVFGATLLQRRMGYFIRDNNCQLYLHKKWEHVTLISCQLIDQILAHCFGLSISFMIWKEGHHQATHLQVWTYRRLAVFHEHMPPCMICREQWKTLQSTPYEDKKRNWLLIKPFWVIVHLSGIYMCCCWRLNV